MSFLDFSALPKKNGAITAETGATVQGQLLARNGAVMLDRNTINNEVCATDVGGENGNGENGDDEQVSDGEEEKDPPEPVDIHISR
jgi:hypothetical protein